MKTKIFLAALIGLAVLFAGCTQYSPSPGTTGNGTFVTISNFSFSPSTITTSVGGTVAWVNNDSFQHTIISDSGTELNSNLLPVGQTFSHTFNSAGTYAYHCGIHPSMKGTIIVQ
ncbi:MAG TPA: cupredoxin family copper-binding protein [archaeon]|nr:cupredoxin family copper-binding protein [archaeon]